MNIIGKTKCRLTDYFEWFKIHGLEWAETVIESVNEQRNIREPDLFEKIFKKYYTYNSGYTNLLSLRLHKDDKNCKWSSESIEYAIQDLANAIGDINRYCNLLEESLDFSICETNIKFDGIYVIKLQNTEALIVPKEFLYDTVFFKDYSNINSDNLNNMMEGGNSLMPTNGLSVSKEDIKSELSSIAENSNNFKELETKIYRSETDGLKEIKAEIEKLENKLRIERKKQLEEIHKKMEELQALKERMETQLFLLDTQIYGIQCFMGETVNFIKIRSGKDAPIDMPVTIYQKLRYMDEELGLLSSIYDVDFKNAKIFEKLLQCNDYAMDLFLPNEKCISFMRVTLNASYFEKDAYDGIVYEYEKFHGKRVAILIRNGENVYIGWTDESRVSIQENAFYNPNESSTEILIDDEFKVKSDNKNTIASRYFIYSIMQGIFKSQKLLSFPEPVSVLGSKYVNLSFAAGWVTDNRFGSFANIQEKVNERVVKGDNVILLQSLYDTKHWDYRSRTYEPCDRSHGEANRTNDCKLEANKIYPVSLVETHSDGYNGVYIRATKMIWSGTMKWGYEEHETGANFHIYNNEFLNLTYMNSIWVDYIIINRNIGNMGNKIDYAYLIHALKIAKEYLQEREEKEVAFIKKYCRYIENRNEWQVELSEWKLKNKVRVINDFQAKRFASSIS